MSTFNLRVFKRFAGLCTLSFGGCKVGSMEREMTLAACILLACIVGLLVAIWVREDF